MTSTLRAGLAALAMAFSAFVVTASCSLDALGADAALVMLVVFLTGWLIAVGERAVMPRGGLRLTRFPIGPRLLSTHPSLAMQFIVFIALLGLATGSWAVAGWATLIVGTVSIHALRRAAWYVVPAALLINTLATMKEFHTLGDLVKDASSWVQTLVTFGISAFMICGPLLRTDMAVPLSLRARCIALLAGLPAWGGAFWIFSRTPLAGARPGLEGLMLVLLIGGIAQSVIVGLLAKLIALDERASPRTPVPSAHGVGLALMPMLVPLLACLALFLMPAAENTFAGHDPVEWMGLMVVLFLVPAVPAALLVGAGLDRLDRRNSGLVGSVVAVAMLGAWFLLGPVLIGALYAPDGPAALARATFDMHGTAVPLIAQRVNAGALFTGGHFGGDVSLGGLLVADLARAITLMFLGAAALTARYLRHARPAQRPAGWLWHLALGGLMAAGCWHFMPRIGPAGAPLAAACACVVLLTLDILHAEIRIKVPGEEPAPLDDVGPLAPAPSAPLLSADDDARDIRTIT
ncbi:MAG TPA: hypothetical protein VK824_11555 [Planctomycetota bacterium]|nr:hypothetical protein [Planctomycetota bacterium]